MKTLPLIPNENLDIEDYAVESLEGCVHCRSSAMMSQRWQFAAGPSATNPMTSQSLWYLRRTLRIARMQETGRGVHVL